VRVGEQTLQQAYSQEYPGSARCVQNFDDSLDSAIRITYRISLRSSSMWEPRHPSLKVVFHSVMSAAQASLFLQRGHAKYAALGFSVSQWRQVSNLVWGFGFKKDTTSCFRTRRRERGADVSQTLLFSLSFLFVHGCLSLRTCKVCRMILPQVHLR
jgi:hypothetical protein